MAFSEQDIISEIATQERSIVGVKNSYGFADNPDSLTTGLLPAVLHYIPVVESSPAGHHNLWKNIIVVKSIICVAPRTVQGGKLKFLENAAIPFGQKWRLKFQNDDVIKTLLANTISVRCFLTNLIYGAGGPELTVGDVEFIGWVGSFEFSNRA